MSPRPPFVEAMGELEAFAKESGWEWSQMGHAELIRKLIEEVKTARLEPKVRKREGAT